MCVHQEAGHQHQDITHRRHDHHNAHELLAVDLPGDVGVEHHENGGCHHAHGGEGGVQSSGIAEGEVDISRSDTADDNVIAYLLNQENHE